MLPAALLTAGLASLAVDIVAFMAASAGNGALGLLQSEQLWQLVRLSVAGFVFVMAGTAIAPIRRPGVPLSLASLYSVGVALIMSGAFGASISVRNSTGWVVAYAAVAVAATFGAAVYVGFRRSGPSPSPAPHE